MATEAQNKYIADLVVLKTKEFKEVKEILLASGIVSDHAETVKNAQSIAEINNALTDKQASQFIDVLIGTKEPARGRVYSQGRVRKTLAIFDDITKTVDDWGF
jgi:hypothetical protein